MANDLNVFLDMAHKTKASKAMYQHMDRTGQKSKAVFTGDAIQGLSRIRSTKSLKADLGLICETTGRRLK